MVRCENESILNKLKIQSKYEKNKDTKSKLDRHEFNTEQGITVSIAVGDTWKHNNKKANVHKH